MSKAERLLACTLTYRESSRREQPVPDWFPSTDQAVTTFTEVLLHEAREASEHPIAAPDNPYLHPVDVDTDAPGIVDTRDTFHVARFEGNLPRVVYTPARSGASRRLARGTAPGTLDVDKGDAVVDPPRVDVAVDTAQAEAERLCREALHKEERRSATAVRSMQRREDANKEGKKQREAETGDERKERLRLDKERRGAKKAAKAAALTASPGSPGEGERASVEPAALAPQKRRRVQLPQSEDSMLIPDASAPGPLVPRAVKRKEGETQFFGTPIPHHRHLYGLQRSNPSDAVEPALLRATPCPGLVVIVGPPGTGKTRELVARIPETGRVLLVAPTNVGAANLYSKCIEAGMGDECALVLPPDRVPSGTAVASNDPGRRVVCATVSSRGGRALDAEVFGSVLLDEAAQCMEAWVWTLLRTEVRLLVLAGDTMQLPALVSETGKELGHERSLMERLLACDYPCTRLVVQNRMAPDLLRVTNTLFYDGTLTTGPHAPSAGFLEWIEVPSGTEKAGRLSSFTNPLEVEAVRSVLDSKGLLRPTADRASARGEEAQEAQEKGDERGSGPEAGPSCVILTPYAAQRQRLLALESGREVHTVDSFQGREADIVVLSVVRDGSRGMGFWDDRRRLVVALSRARVRLVVVASSTRWPEKADLCRVRDLMVAAGSS